MYVFKAHLPTRAMDTSTFFERFRYSLTLKSATPLRVRIALPTLSFVVICSSRGQKKPTIAAGQPPLHSYVLRSLATTADRRKASLIHRFTTERLWLYSSTRPI